VRSGRTCARAPRRNGQARDGRELLWQLLRAAYIEDHSLFVIGFELPMLLISAFPDDTVRAQAAKLGVLLLAKPFTSAQLRAAVAEL